MIDQQGLDVNNGMVYMLQVLMSLQVKRLP